MLAINPTIEEAMTPKTEEKLKPNERLAEARIAAGFRSARAAALENGWTESTYRAHESGIRNYDRRDARKYARVFGIDPKTIYLDEEDGEESTSVAVPRRPETVPAPLYKSATLPKSSGNELPYAGVVEAGAWREVEDLNQQGEHKISRSRDIRFGKARQYVWKVEGDSMNEAGLGPGMMIIGVDYNDFVEHYGTVETGRFVVVEARDGSRRERTVKEARVFRDRIELHPRSNNKRHQPIIVPRNHDHDGDQEVRILAVVAEAFQQF